MNYLLDIKSTFLPEIIIIAFIFIQAFLGIFLKKQFYKTSRWIAVLGILCAFCGISFLQAEPTYSAFNGSIICNMYTVFFKGLILIASFFIVLLSFKEIKKLKMKSFTYFSILFSGIFGALLTTCSNDFLTAFVALEIILISTSIVLSIKQGEAAKISSIKHLTIGIIASSLFAIGVSYLYGITGSINFDAITTSLIGYEGGLLYSISIAMIILSLLFWLGFIPFAHCENNVFECATHSNILFLSLIPRFAAISLISRCLFLAPNHTSILSFILIMLAILSIIIGLYGLKKENDTKKLIQYSLIVQLGFLMMPLCVINTYNIACLLYCLICYLFMAIAICAGVMTVYNITKCNDINIYKGLAYKKPFYTTAMIFVFLAFASLPPTCGFISKFFVLASITRLGIFYFVFLIMALLLSVICIIAYIRPIKILFERAEDKLFLNNSSIFSKITLYVSTAIIIIPCFGSNKIIELCELIAYSL